MMEAVDNKERSGKVRIELVTPACIIGMAEVLTKGLEKYPYPGSWRDVEEPIDTHYGALMRHLMAWRSGDLDDSETGLSHVKHVMANAMFLLDHEEAMLR